MPSDRPLHAIERAVPLSEPVIDGNEWVYVKECLDTGWLSTAGPFVDRFEAAIASYVDVPHAVATSSGTAAIHAALLSVGVESGDEVLVSDLTFIAPVNAIHYCGARPVLMDVAPDTWQMDASKVEAFLTTECERRDGECFNRRTGRRVRAVLPVHILGLACEIDRIVSVARDRGVRVVEDATEAMGVRYRGRHVGTFGDAGAFSFNGNKIITTGGGGMLVTEDPTLAKRAKYLTTQAKDDPVEYVHREVGFNYRLTNLQAAVGLAQLEQLGRFISRKREIARAYDAGIAAMAGLTPMPAPLAVTSNYWLYTALLPATTDVTGRKTVVRRLNEQGIGARPLWHTIHDLPPYRSCQAYRIEHSVSLYARAVTLPSGAGLTDAEVERCIDALRGAIHR